MHVLYRARWSFVGQTRSFLDTGRLMARWSAQAIELLAPTLEWTSTVEQHSDYELVESWESSHVVRYRADARGEGRSELVAGGRGKKVGGSGRVTLTALRPFAFFEADGHCDVEHWDVLAGGVSETAIDAVRLLLEAEIGATAQVVVNELESFARSAVVVASTRDEDEARLWAGDLDDVGLLADAEPEGDGWAVRIRASEVESLEALGEARVALGEVLAEAGHEDWSTRADAVLARLPDHAS
ncbi:MAG: hypothetical protein R3B82_10040 [Sandaracinaceae bacterium]